jgi:hypothetical protein
MRSRGLLAPTPGSSPSQPKPWRRPDPYDLRLGAPPFVSPGVRPCVAAWPELACGQYDLERDPGLHVQAQVTVHDLVIVIVQSLQVAVGCPHDLCDVPLDVRVAVGLFGAEIGRAAEAFARGPSTGRRRRGAAGA